MKHGQETLISFTDHILIEVGLQMWPLYWPSNVYSIANPDRILYFYFGSGHVTSSVNVLLHPVKF